ncbi:MAG: site-specific integrase [Phycisphaeraceae bacterium]
MAHHAFKPKRKDPKTGKPIVSRIWHGQYRLEGDLRYTRQSLNTTDKRVAEKRLAELVRQEEYRREGLCTPAVLTEAAAKPLLEHLEDWLDDLRARSRSRDYTRKLHQRVSHLAHQCQWERLAEVSPEQFLRWRQRENLSAKTLNDYLDAIRSLFVWLQRAGRVNANPLEHVGKIDRCGRQTFTRRALTDGEVTALLAVNEHRKTIYLLALHTGLRHGELRSLRWSDVNLHEGFIRLRAEATKAKRGDLLPLTAIARMVLRQLQDDASPLGDLVFTGGVPSHHTFAADLEKARIPRYDHRNFKVDFHALRTTFITNLARAGVPQRQAMALARHTDPKLTANLYTDQEALPLAAAVDKLPDYGMANTTEHAHGRSHEMVAAGHRMSQPDARRRLAEVTEDELNKAVAGVSGRQHATPTDTEHKWSRGDSNPREIAVSGSSAGVLTLIGTPASDSSWRVGTTTGIELTNDRSPCVFRSV